MSYNLSSTLLKIKKDSDNEKNKDMFFVLEEEDFIMRFEDEGRYVYLNSVAAKPLIEGFKEHIVKAFLPVYDYVELLKEKTEEPEKYIRFDLYGDVVSFVNKILFKERGKEFFYENEAIFKNNEIIYIYGQPEQTSKEVQVLCFEECENEWTCGYLDRKHYTRFLPKPVDEFYETFLITKKDEYEKFKKPNDFYEETKEHRPMESWTFTEKENIILVVK